MLRVIPVPKYRISPYLFMQFAEPLGTADSSIDAAWDALENRWHPQVLDMIRKLAPPMIRFGGCFSSYYHWREAVGPRAERVPMHNLCWDGTFSNQVGTAELLELCRAAGSEPLFCVNFESDGRKTWARPRPGMNRLGTAREAAEWVAYCNDPENPLRLRHGAKEPYRVRYWQLGNETSYGYCESTGGRKSVRDGFDCGEYLAALKRFSAAMRGADRDLVLIAWGDDRWAPRLCEEASDAFDLVAFHHHYSYPADGSRGPVFGAEYRKDPQAAWECMLDTWRGVDRKIREMRELLAGSGKRLAMTEGHYNISGRNRGDVLSTWTAGVAYARIINTLLRHGDMLEIATCADFFGNRWQVNALMLPTPAWGGTPYLMPVGQVMALFGRNVGEYFCDSVCGDARIDATASLSGNRLFLHLVNTERRNSVTTELDIANRRIRSGRIRQIAADPELEIADLNASAIDPVERPLDGPRVTLAAAGVAAVELELEPEEPHP